MLRPKPGMWPTIAQSPASGDLGCIESWAGPAAPQVDEPRGAARPSARCDGPGRRSEEHTSELQSLMRISYAVFCLKKKKRTITIQNRRVFKRTKKHSRS